MKKLLTIVVLSVLVSTVISSCASRNNGGCPTNNPRYFRR